MKKIFIIAGLLFAGIVSAQQQKGSIGVNAEPNGATLQVNISSASDLDKTKGQGLAVPNVTKATLSAMTSTIATSAMVYVIGDSSNTDTNFADTTTNVTRTNKVTGLGYYYFNGTQWVQLGEAKPEGTFTRNVRDFAGTTENATKDDFFLRYTGTALTTVTLPADAAHGQTLCFFNGSTENDINFSPALKGGYVVTVGQTTLCVIKVGSDWYPLSGS